ncbi:MULTISPECIES: hypothetical protein [Asticcacaulis]|uniref:hypothetical protein n=1 Tax=Asticcacaulis TaxID=76890 RepID=UPI001AE6778B|nr:MULTISPECIES: hypothetical protein [Asticcacaulis]MBP2161663.1 hypothetical protein [Asticcacaulis solisilvae]MDR6802712.1 hypothetical protein [Asticcacaulis sp. BE141]
MKPILPIAAAAAFVFAAAAAPVLSQSTTAETDAEICVAADTQSSWAAGNASSRIAQPNKTVADQQAYCAGLKAAAGTNAGTTATTDNRGSVGDNSGATGAKTPDAADTDTAAGMTTTMDPNAKPGD